ncbi:MAG: putative anti-sigma regulatory factor, serine/threonine protein kinase, partial [Actinomycetia bacterium]|nr:putative anti-sigma regulatory factor, serine/threonine protein kinase [Actinomycetes bacterium]
VELERSRGFFRCTVRDDSPAAPRRRRYSTDAVTGRGIALVETLAARWGSERDGTGKFVWFEMDVSDARDERGVIA